MRFYQGDHRFYCGIDLHARTMHVCIVDEAGRLVADRNIAAHAETFLELIAPFRDGIVVGAECMFCWYWLADFCAEEGIPFVLGHALYMRLIHGAKAKNDRIDAGKIARLLRGGTFPPAYVYPPGMRETRDLLRRRMYLVHERAALVTHVQIINSQYNLPALGKNFGEGGQADKSRIVERFAHASVRRSVAADLELIEHLERLIDDLEGYLVQTAKVDDVVTYERLQTVPGVGKLLGLVLLYEMHAGARFPTAAQFLSYARLVRCQHESAGKKVGTGGKKIGNAHLKWAFGEVACHFVQASARGRQWKQRYQQQHGKGKALGVLAARLGRAVYHMLRKEEAFEEERFWHGAAGKRKAGSAGRDVVADVTCRRTGSSSLLPEGA
jgi:transposase